MSLAVIIASSGRPSLRAAVESVTPQLQAGDRLLVDVNHDAPWGHAARNRSMPLVNATHLLFLDDDDCYMAGALDQIRKAVSPRPGRIHMFKMRYADSGRELWADEVVREGNVSTQMVCVPNRPGLLGRWGDRYEGDFDFIASTVALQGQPVWHPDVVALIRP